MQIKSELRKELLLKRKNVDKKSQKDESICENLICSDVYLDAKQVLFYAALDDEINVDECINDALMLGKKVALPRCINSNGDMKFYFINSLDELESGHFGVREPKEDSKNEVLNYESTICIVPGVAFDKKGYRLGYGKGYYDRFLKKSTALSVGLCYNELVNDKLPIDEYDIAVDYIVDENGIVKVK